MFNFIIFAAPGYFEKPERNKNKRRKKKNCPDNVRSPN